MPRRRPARIPSLLLLATLSLVATAALPAGAVATTRTADPVLVAINGAAKASRITPMEARDLRLTWAASARAQRTARTGSRRAAIASVRSYTTKLARSRGLTPERLQPVLLSVEATTWTMLKSTSFPRHEEEVTIPGEVIVFTYYSGRGVQFQPFETFKQGLRELNQLKPDVVAARAIADRMVDLSVPRGPAVTWEYYFPFGGPSRPWTSSISQAVATEFFHRVGTAVPAGEGATYAAIAEGAARSFQLDASRGGVSVAQGTGRFYVMYPFARSQRILNGHLQVLLNVNRYARASGSKVAAQVVTAGIVGVVPLMPRFDTGAWSNYQPGQEAELGYHEFQTEQLVKLGDELEDPRFGAYGARFTTYLETPPKVSFPTTRFRAIWGAHDGYRDTTVIPWTVDKRAKVTMIIKDSAGVEVRRLVHSRGRGTSSFTWDGLDAHRRAVAPGDYAVTFVAKDVVSNRSDTQVGAPIRVLADQLPPTLRLVTMRERAGTSIVTAGVADAFSASVTAQLRIGGKVVASTRGARVGTLTLRARRALADVKRGELVLRDTSGNQFVYPLTAG